MATTRDGDFTHNWSCGGMDPPDPDQGPWRSGHLIFYPSPALVLSRDCYVVLPLKSIIESKSFQVTPKMASRQEATIRLHRKVCCRYRYNIFLEQQGVEAALQFQEQRAASNKRAPQCNATRPDLGDGKTPGSARHHTLPTTANPCRSLCPIVRFPLPLFCRHSLPRRSLLTSILIPETL